MSKTSFHPIGQFLIAGAIFLCFVESFGQEVPVLEWAKSVGSSSNLSPRDMYRDAAGNIYTIGDFWNTADFDPGPGTANLTSLGGYDIYITKFDASGNYVWAKSLGGTRYNFGYGITADAAGNVYTTGWYDGTVDFDPGVGTFNLSAKNTSGFYDVFISKLDANGDFVWAKSFGGSGSDEGMGIELDTSGNIYIAGSYAQSVDFDPGVGIFNITSPDFDAIFISKYDTNGNFIWAKSIDGKFNQEAYNLALDAAGNVYTTGRLYGTPSDPVDFDPGPGVFNLAPDQNAFFISKLDVNGNFVWAKLIEGDYGQDIAFDASDNVYVTGKFVGTTDFDPNPGIFNLTSAAGPGDIFVMKLTSTGNFTWAKQMGGTGFTIFSSNENRGYGITVDPNGNVLTTGKFAGTGDFDPGPGTFTLSANSTGYTNGFISKLDTDGNFIWATAFGANSSYESGYSITTDNFGYIYSFGQYQGTCDFDPSACTFNLTGPNGAYVWKLSLGTAIPAPIITSFTPSTGSIGTTVTLTGNNFSSTPSNNLVTFFNNRTATVTASSPTSITTTVPASSTTGKLSVTVNCMTVQSATNFTVGASTLPTITSFTPTSGPISTTVTITGTNFSTTPANNLVRFNGTTAVVTASTATSITTTVPTGATTGTISVTVAGNTATSTSNFTVTTPAPTITSFTPTSGPVGTTVAITGTNFSPTPSNNAVKFNGTSATVTTSSATSITVTVPTGATTGTITVTVAGNTATSATNFTVTVTPIITITTQPTQASVCDGATAGFNTAATGTTNITYQWQFSPNGPPAFADIVNGSKYSGATTNSLSINTTGGFGEGRYRCRINGDLATEVITNDEGLFVNSVPAAPVTTGNSGCNSASVSLIASGGVNGQYRWYTTASGGTALPGEVNSTYLTPTLSSTTTYYPSINNGTCESPRTSVTATINVVSKPLVVTSNCTSSSATLSGPGGFATYTWSNSATTQAIVVSTAGSYSLVVTAANGCVSPPSDATTLTSTFCNQPPLISNTAISTVTEGTVTLSISALLSDPDDNLDLSTLTVVTQPTSGAIASIGPNATLTIDYKGKPFAGKDELTLGVCDLSGVCTENVVSVDVAGEIIVNNGISPNGDTKNDAWIIQYIDVFPETKVNHVSLFNRWGDAVFETDNYDNVDRVFKGVNTGGNELPTGTYFYKIEFASGRKTMTGYLSLKR